MTETVTTKNESKQADPIRMPVKRMDGSTTGEEVELDPRLFGLERNEHVLYLAVKTEMTNRRQGTRSTKGRSEVRGGGRKPWRQKGRGGARAGTSRSPIWRSGGIIFGPKPHDFSMKLPKKMKRLARRIAYSVKAQSGAIDLVEDISIDKPKTAKIAGMLNNFGITGRSSLLLLDGNDQTIVKSCQNIPRMEVRECQNASTWDILRARHIIISRSALKALTAGLDNE